MDRKYRISVALAAYKGEDFIGEQLRSILSQLAPDDEVVVSDDFPEGKTKDVILEIGGEDGRIRYIEGPGKGLIMNFENAINACTGDYIFLADQDDVWLPDKVEKVCEKLEAGADLVLHNAMVTDGKLKIQDTSFFKSHGTKTGYLNNLIRNSYMGCCMAFRKSLCGKIMPFPQNLPMHDQWIGLIAEKTGKVCLIDKPLILYRRHGGNMTGGQTSLKKKIMWRLSIAQELKKRLSAE
ncbi:MAG: glycosyltransferase family 2 protein [Ruminococcaceae bacterium]|nr:glycosyltransferase family 2 protein [Oscillospiraceae bacterium]